MNDRVAFVLGDITALEADGIVNAANNELWMGAGVAGAILRVGGQEIEDEAVAKGPIAVGQALATKAGRLKAKYVLHAAVMGVDFLTDGGKIRDATANTLLLAEELKLSSIVFPALGTGVGKFPMEEAARIMLAEVRAHWTVHAGLEKIIFVLNREDAVKTFERVWKEMKER